MGGQSKHDEFFIVVIVGLCKCVPYLFVNSTPKTSDKKATNGNHHAMLKVIQHGVTIAKF
jgi:hypothetical protein